MKILNKTLLAGILFASALLSGCSDDEYTPGEASNASGINVYFESPVSAEVALGPDDTAFTITVGRNQTDGALSVPLKNDKRLRRSVRSSRTSRFRTRRKQQNPYRKGKQQHGHVRILPHDPDY